MQLYTSLVRLKQSMNGGHLPPMTPVPESEFDLIDPAFTIGMGALIEDAQRGLRCPVRGCGRWYQGLHFHLDRGHADIGGSRAVRKSLDIPDTAPLFGQKELERRSAVMSRLRATGIIHGQRGVTHRRGCAQTRARTYSSIGARNLRNTCEAQLSHRLIDLHNKIGRSPTQKEFADEYGYGIIAAVVLAFGSFNNAKASCGLAVYQRHKDKPAKQEQMREQAVCALRAWYESHGSLPSSDTASNPNRTPLIPSRQAILRAMRTTAWPEAMRRVASILNIYGGRYGLPIENEPKEAVA